MFRFELQNIRISQGQHERQNKQLRIDSMLLLNNATIYLQKKNVFWLTDFDLVRISRFTRVEVFNFGIRVASAKYL